MGKTRALGYCYLLGVGKRQGVAFNLKSGWQHPGSLVLFAEPPRACLPLKKLLPFCSRPSNGCCLRFPFRSTIF